MFSALRHYSYVILIVVQSNLVLLGLIILSQRAEIQPPVLQLCVLAVASMYRNGQDEANRPNRFPINLDLHLHHILNRNNTEKNIVIAAACGSNAARLLPELRRKINDKIKEILPPKSVDASERLSGAGEFVVPYLKHKEAMSPDERYYSLNTLRMISSTQALAVAGSYLKNTAEPREIDIIGSMLEAYTKKELQSVDFEKIVVNYIASASETQTLYIPENFLRILLTIPFAERGEEEV